MLLRPSPARLAAFLPLLLHPRRFSDASRALRRDLRAGHGPIRPELIERVSRLLVLGRYDALHDLSLDFSDQLLNSLLRTSRLHPQACLENDILNLHKFHQCLQGSAVKLVLHCTKQTTLVKSRDLELRHLEPTT
ncbi:hypothetical protein F2Q68_00040884 [Brassica cretica]|uniref:Uncharacterized protein n=1 Tax=Brassica cretica TaxID=69181 RepID=A0A8S9MFK0_BRACR|nr:hypothetical protein F2Q68_00040884 [Brassica cretica]